VAAARTVTTTAGQFATITVDHGTRIFVAPRTTLSVLGDDVTLVGEAYFVVSHHAAIPFTVRTGSVVTRVLGTAFEVQRYRSDTATRVVVTEGKVVTGATHAVTMLPGQMAYVTDSMAIVTTSEDVSRYTSWTGGRVQFANIETRQLLDIIGRWYGVQFRMTDTTRASEVVSVRLDGQPLPSVLTMLRTVLDVTMTFDGNIVTLHAKTHPPVAPVRGALRDTFSMTQSEVGR